MPDPGTPGASLKAAVQRWSVPLLFLLFSTGVAMYFTGRSDIGLYDETAYLQRGTAIDAHGLPGADMAPLYSLWYRCLQFVVPDAVLRYQVNLGLTIALLPFTFLLLLRALRTSTTASLVSAVLLLFSTLNVLNWPRVSVFALILLFIGLRLFIRSRDRDRGWLHLILSVASVVFIRPEFALALGGLGVCWAAEFRHRRRTGATVRFRTPAIALVWVLALFASLGNPFANGRTMVAFGQHYALNWTEATDSDLDPWTNWETIARTQLGTSTSLSQAFSHAPDRLLWHIGQNLRSIVPVAQRMLMPAGARPDRLAGVLIGLLLLPTAFIAWRRNTPNGTLPGMTSIGTVLSVICLPAAASMILIHPRAHYMIFPLTLFLALLVARAFRPTEPKSLNRLWMLPLLAGAALLGFYGGRPIAAAERPVLATINTLRALPMNTPIHLLDADGGYDAYLAKGTVQYIAQGKKTGFNAYLQEHPINVIVASTRLMNDQRYSDDPAWRSFVAGGHRSAFDRMTVKGTRVELFVARSALRRPL